MNNANDLGNDQYLYRRYKSWKGWDSPFKYTAEDAAYFLGECRMLRIKDSDVLEIGFGSGNFLAWARDRGARIYGSEINAVSLRAAKEASVAIIPADFEKVAVEQVDRFDTVIAFDVFEHFSLDEIIIRLKALETMLRSGGQLLMRFPNAQSPFGLAPQNGDPTHRTALSRSVFELLVQGTSFTIVHYAPSFRVLGGGLARSLARRLRYALRSAISGFFNFVYANDIPYDPVVVIVLRKDV